MILEYKEIQNPTGKGQGGAETVLGGEIRSPDTSHGAPSKTQLQTVRLSLISPGRVVTTCLLSYRVHGKRSLDNATE